MRTVLIGSDFMYDRDGNLRPVEINTAIGWHDNKLESDSESFDLSALLTFIQNGLFTKVVYIGALTVISTKLEEFCISTNIEYEFLTTSLNAITIPLVEDNEQTLIIRSAYDTTAIVDDMYCRDKIQFLELIKSESFGAQFAYINDDNELVNHITTINDNGEHPNFILKARFPQYDREVFPKLFKVTSQEELLIVLQNVTEEYFLMEYYFNSEKLYEDHITVIRELSLLHPPTLEAIQIGSYSTFNNNTTLGTNEFDPQTFELLDNRNKYISTFSAIRLPKLQDSDLVIMADGSTKTGLDIQVGDMIKTIDIPNPFNVNRRSEVVNYRISYEELQSGTTYSSNIITHKRRIDTYYHVVKLVFTDNTDWLDTQHSKYLSIKNNEIRFLTLTDVNSDESKLSIGDKIILLNTNSTELTFVEKEVASIEYTQEFFGGWIITVENESLFLTRASLEDDTSFVAVEHNGGESCSDYYSCYNPADCPGKFDICCYGICETY